MHVAANVEAQESSKGEGGVCLMSELALLGTQHQIQPIYFSAKKPWPHPRTYTMYLWFQINGKCDREVLGNLPCEVVGCGTFERAFFLASYGEVERCLCRKGDGRLSRPGKLC